jgi:hypothetical protein
MADKPKRIDKAFERAAVRTVNQLLLKSRTQGTKKVRETYNIKAGALKKQTTLRRAKPKFPLGYLEVKGRALPVYLFGPRHDRNKPGASVRILRTEGRKIIRGSFIAQMKSGHVGVFMRKTVQRLPIKELYTVGPAKMFEARTTGLFNKLVAREGPKLFRTNLNFYLARETFR